MWTDVLTGISEDILGIFYREIAKLGKDLKTYRLRGLANSDLILDDEFYEKAPEIYVC